jgi:hypothetical protein
MATQWMVAQLTARHLEGLQGHDQYMVGIHQAGGLQHCRPMHSTGTQDTQHPWIQHFGACKGLLRTVEMLGNGQVWGKLEQLLGSKSANW